MFLNKNRSNFYLLFVLDFGDFCQPFESDSNEEDYPYSASTIILQFQTDSINAPVGSGFVLKFVRNNIILEESTTQVSTDNISRFPLKVLMCCPLLN